MIQKIQKSDPSETGRSGYARRNLGLVAGLALLTLAACDNAGLDWDLRDMRVMNTADAARQVTESRPEPDARGVISYPNYQVAVARRGDTVADVADRVGLSAGELARFNALDPDTPLRNGEVLALPRRVAAAPAGTTGSSEIDITTLASGAIDRAEGAPAASGAAGREPVRHQVRRGETAFSIARLYNVSTRALADWNGLGPDMTVREGQYLLIPLSDASDTRTAALAAPDATQPGTGSPTPVPPSASEPLPVDSPARPAVEAEAPASPQMVEERTAATPSSRLAMPVDGRIIRAYERGRNDGIGIAADVGTLVRAADDGTVAAITRDTDQVPILVIRHADNLLTVYANIDNIQVERGTRVRRGDTIASVRSGTPSFLHFEVREGFESVDPMPFLQ